MKKRILSIMVIICLLLGIVPINTMAAYHPFDDVNVNDYFYEPVLWALENGITTGNSPTTFGPKKYCTRAQVVTFLWRAAGSPEPEMSESPFTDLKENAYYYKSVLWAVENNITTGNSPTTFGPEKSCTRAQIVTFLWRFAGAQEPFTTKTPFNDLKTEAYYIKPVLWAFENGITTGNSPTTFSPDKYCTRGQIVTFLYRTMNLENNVEMSDVFQEAVELGVAWENLAKNSASSITGHILVELMENALEVLGKSTADEYLSSFDKMYGEDEKIQRYQLAELLYGVYNEVIEGHHYVLNATATYYEVGGTYRGVKSWDCSDLEELYEFSDMNAFNYAICAFDRLTGDKLMKVYDDWSFRPRELVTVESAVETLLHFARSFEKDPVYTDVTNERAAVCTIDAALYTGETTLPDATNQNLPNWRGCNISYNSMFYMALCGNPDDVFVEGNLDYLKEVGVNFVHIYLSWSYFQGPDHTFDNKVNLSRLEQLDEIISWCMERDIHIQLVFNDVPNLDFNYQESVTKWVESSNSVFENEEVRDSVTAFWRMLARRYKDIPNNYLSFNLMNECDPLDDEQYVWGLEPAVKAIWEESPERVIVADVHTSNVAVTGESMAELGCALSYHFYNLQDISVVTPEKEASMPGFYESIKGRNCYVNASLYGPNYWDTNLPEEAKGTMKFTGAVGGATLSVTIQEISWFDTIMKISADGKTLYEGMEPYTYDEAIDLISVNKTVTVTIPEGVSSFEISCPEGSCFTMSDISLTLSSGKEIPFMLIFDVWQGTRLAEITINQDGSFTSTLTLEYLKNGFSQTLADLIDIGEKYGVDVMIGECGFFEGGDFMAVGISQEAIEDLFLDEIETFERLGLAWCFEYVGRYALVTPAPYLEGIEYRDLKNSPYYVNLEMDAFFKKIMLGKN